jgi:hypothetical protein
VYALARTNQRQHRGGLRGDQIDQRLDRAGRLADIPAAQQNETCKLTQQRHAYDRHVALAGKSQRLDFLAERGRLIDLAQHCGAQQLARAFCGRQVHDRLLRARGGRDHLRDALSSLATALGRRDLGHVTGQRGAARRAASRAQ